ncbi:MAG: spore maturation protein A, partial [Oscillospiraceae bacterium]|nr:spore maturation protein A [Oscillospiraceae bacterium]
RSGAAGTLARMLRPLLRRLFPDAADDPETLAAVGGNFTANLLGLGNAATPLGIEAVRRMRLRAPSDRATHEMCRLIVLNSASIQLIPATVIALRASLGAASPADILPAVWLTSLCSAGAGLGACLLFGLRRG